MAIEVENNSLVPWWTGDEGAHTKGYELGSKSFPDKFIFTLPKSKIEKLDANGLCFFSHNLYIKTAAVKKADNKTVIQIDN